MFASNDKKLEILNDHYKDTFSHLIRYRKQRDRLMLCLLVVLVIMYTVQLFPDEATESFSKMLTKKVGVQIPLSILHALAIPYIFFFIISHRYWQLWNLIERQHDYVQELEKELSSLFLSGVPYTRETNFAFKDDVNLSTWSHGIYNHVFNVIVSIWMFLSATFILRYYGFNWDSLIPYTFAALSYIFVRLKLKRSFPRRK